MLLYIFIIVVVIILIGLYFRYSSNQTPDISGVWHSTPSHVLGNATATKIDNNSFSLVFNNKKNIVTLVFTSPNGGNVLISDKIIGNFQYISMANDYKLMINAMSLDPSTVMLSYKPMTVCSMGSDMKNVCITT